jgi:hypothetical protein
LVIAPGFVAELEIAKRVFAPTTSCGRTGETWEPAPDFGRVGLGGIAEGPVILLRPGLPIVFFFLISIGFGRVLGSTTSSHLAVLRDGSLALPRHPNVIVANLGRDRSTWQFASMNSVYPTVSLALKQAGQFGSGEAPNHLRRLCLSVSKCADWTERV